jgi:hypothetical protein
VRFQTGKEMAESVENYAIDYTHLKNGVADRHVMTVAARRDYLTMLQVLCQTAGLKLHAVTPKLFGMAYALDRAVQPDAQPLAPKQLNVILNFGERWAELCFFRGDRLLQAQALANGPLLANEVKRNVAVFLAQTAVNFDLESPECLYVFGEQPAALEKLKSGQQLPVKTVDPLKPDQEAPENPGDFAGAVGLAALWSQPDQKPVNLAAPKRMQAPVSDMTQRGYLYGAAAAVVALLIIGGMWLVLSMKRGEIVRLEQSKLAMQKDWEDAGQIRAELDAYKEWERTTVPWLDELYDLSARYPYQKDFRVNLLNANPMSTTGKKAAGSKEYVGKLTINGHSRIGEDAVIEDLRRKVMTDPHLKVEMGVFRPDNKAFGFEMKIDVAKQDTLKYTTNLEKPQRKTVKVDVPSPPIYIIEKVYKTKKVEEPAEPDDDGDQP